FSVESASRKSSIRNRRDPPKSIVGSSVTARSSRNNEALDLRLAPGQRIGVAIVKLPDPVPVEALFADLEIGSRQRLGRKLFDGEPDRLRGAREAPIAEGRTLVLAVIGREQLGLARVIESARLAGGRDDTGLIERGIDDRLFGGGATHAHIFDKSDG